MKSLFANGNFRRLFAGRLVTNAGDSLYMVAAMWLVYDLTGSPAYTGIAGFLIRLPQLLQVFAGPLVDRWSLRRTLVGTQLFQAALVLAVPVAWALDVLTVELVLVVMPVLSLVNQLVYPAQSAVVPRLVERTELVRANSVMSMAYQGSNLVFNALAGVLVAVAGAVALYVVDSVTFVVAAALFFAVRIPDAVTSDESRTEPGPSATATDGGESTSAFASYVADLKHGLSYVRGTILLPLLFGGVVANFSISATFTVLPAFGDVRGGPEAYGFFLAAVATGSLLGSLVASGVDDWPYGRLTVVGCGLGGLAWLAAVAVPWNPATALLLAAATVPVGVVNVVAMSMVQALVPEDLLGRVSATVGSMTIAMAPLGALLGGLLAEAVGVTLVAGLGGVGLLSIAAYTLGHPELRRMGPAGQMETLERRNASGE